ncbi:substrate-binding periplasmic protein [Kordiimonas pumila]|uniref:Substrate-binding periplasmic protein n=1 Tax=Kordiimonas pumila TaxID=2161677 RepID=A0ABV7D7N8_9PROT|nr:transporter substrate-binding domain-containing protein [Kordiimonas pumila]
MVKLLVVFVWASVSFSGALQAENSVKASRLGDSVFRDVWHAILDKAGIEAEMIAATRDIRRDMFARGELVLDCCSVPAWRSRPEEVAAQLWSEPFFYTADHLILHKDRTYDLPNPLDLRSYRVGVVQGFAYAEDTLFGEKVIRPSLADVFQSVVNEEADLTIANHQEFWRRQKLAPKPLVLGPVYHELALMARVHNSRPDLLARVNEAIRELKNTGQITILTGARIRDVSEAE